MVDQGWGAVCAFLTHGLASPDHFPGEAVDGNNISLGPARCAKQLIAIDQQVFSDAPFDIWRAEVFEYIDGPNEITVVGIAADQLSKAADQVYLSVINQWCL